MSFADIALIGPLLSFVIFLTGAVIDDYRHEQKRWNAKAFAEKTDRLERELFPEWFADELPAPPSDAVSFTGREYRMAVGPDGRRFRHYSDGRRIYEVTARTKPRGRWYAEPMHEVRGRYDAR